MTSASPAADKGGNHAADTNRIATHASKATDVIAALRGATASRHSTLDAAMPLAGNAPDLHDYARHLQILRAWLAPIESELLRFADGPQDVAILPDTRRLALIDSDLADPALATVGLPPPASIAASPIPVHPEAAYRWGICYVIEGSQLGGAVLYRNLSDRLAPHPLRYLSGDGHPPGPRWQRFLRSIREQVRSDEDIALACSGACAAFDSIIAMVERRGG